MKGVDSTTGAVPDDINPQVLTLRHHRDKDFQKFELKSADRLFMEHQSEVDRSAQTLIDSLSKIQESMRLHPVEQGIPSIKSREQGGSRMHRDAVKTAISDSGQGPRRHENEGTVEVRQQLQVIAPSKHSEDAVLPALRMGVKMTFEE